MKSRTNQPIYNDNGKLAQDMPNTTASDSGKVLGVDESGKVVPVSSGTKLYRHEISFNDISFLIIFTTEKEELNTETKISNFIDLSLGKVINAYYCSGGYGNGIYLSINTSAHTIYYLDEEEGLTTETYDYSSITDTVTEL